MAMNITTGYPMRTGDIKKDYELLYSGFCSLLDELGYMLPLIDTRINGIIPVDTSNDESTDTPEE